MLIIGEKFVLEDPLAVLGRGYGPGPLDVVINEVLYLETAYQIELFSQRIWNKLSYEGRKNN